MQAGDAGKAAKAGDDFRPAMYEAAPIGQFSPTFSTFHIS